MSTAYQPQGFHAVTPYLIVPDAPLMIQFLKDSFDVKELILVENDQGRVQHSAFSLGDSVIELGESQSQWAPLCAGLHVYVPDADATYARAIAAGGTSLYEPADMPYGERSGGVKDPAGNHWYIATTLVKSEG